MAGKAIPKDLKMKMAQSLVGSGPSLVPGVTSTPTPPPAEEQLTPPIEELIADAEDRETLRGLIAAQLPLNSQKKALESKLDGINSRIKGIVGQYGFDKATCDGATISYYPTTRSTINRIKLLALGVDDATIDQATDTSTSFTLKVTGPK